MAQYPPGFTPDPEGFTPDPEGFIPDANEPAFEPGTMQSIKSKIVYPPSRLGGRKLSNYPTEAEAYSKFLETRPDQRMFGGYETIFDDIRNSIVNKIALSPYIPESIKPAVASTVVGVQEIPRTIVDLFSTPESVLAPGIVKAIGRKPPIPEVLPPAPKVPLALPAPARPRFIAGPGGVLPENLINPQEEARLLGYEVPPAAPTGVRENFVDLDAIREQERIRNLYYTQHEQAGGTALEVPDQPNVALPPVAGETRLGFEPVSRAENLPYPLNVVPEAVRPRAAQTVIRALAGDVAPAVEKEATTFANEIPGFTPDEPPTFDLRGGTAALRPGEPILPSALKDTVRKARENTGLNIDEQTVANAPEPLKAGVAKLVASESKLPSPWRALKTQLGELSPALRMKVERFTQLKRQYGQKWIPTLENTINKLSKTEKANFGGYVEGSIPITSPTVQRAVYAWRAVENAIGDEAARVGVRLFKSSKKWIPFIKNTENYWPHIPAERLNKETLIDRLVSSGLSRSEARRVATHYVQEGEIVLGAQRARIPGSKIPYRLDADVAVIHARNWADRIAKHIEFGPKDVAGKEAEGVADLIEATKDPTLTSKLMERVLSREERPNAALARALDLSRKFSSLFHLQNYTVPNVIFGQSSNALMASRRPVYALKEVAKLFQSRYRGVLGESGAWQNYHTLAEELAMKNLDPYLIGPGEIINRGVASAIGRGVAKGAFAELRKAVEAGKNVYPKRALKELQELILEDPIAVARQSELTNDQLNMAAGRAAELSQGLNVPANLPYWASQPVRNVTDFLGQLMWQFKKMGYQQTKFVYDSIKANPKVAIPTYLALSQLTGELVGDIKQGLKGLWTGDVEDRLENRGADMLTGNGITPAMIQELADASGTDPETIARILSNAGQSFMLGLPADLLMSAGYGPQGLSSAAFGAVPSDVSKIANKLYQGDITGLGREAVKMAPIPGSIGLSEAIFKNED